jgi:hypothetical protein
LPTPSRRGLALKRSNRSSSSPQGR